MKMNIKSVSEDMGSPMITIRNDGLVVREFKRDISVNMMDFKFGINADTEEDAIIKLYKYLHRKIFNI